MSRNKVVVISLIVIVILITSFFVGKFYSPYGGSGAQPPFENKTLPPRTISEIASATAPMAVPMTTSQGAGLVQAQERMVIYNGYISLETSDIQGGLAKIRSLAEAYGGYVASSSRSSTGVQAIAEITIRVPKDKFHVTVQEIEGYGKVVNEQTTSEDITQQYIDLKARLDNLQSQEKRLRDILELAKTVDEILNVEKELEHVRGDIESLQGQINYLDRSVAMSLITVSLQEPSPPFTLPGMDWRDTFQIALTGLFTVVRGLIILIVSMLPFIIIGVIVFAGYRWRKRKETR